jgi:amino acid permease
MDIDLKTIIDALNAICAALSSNPYILIFFVSLIIGSVLKNVDAFKIKEIPNWVIPAILAVLGLVAGIIFANTPDLKPHETVLQARFQGALMGLFFAWASTGAHQMVYQLITRGKASIVPLSDEAKALALQVDADKK